MEFQKWYPARKEKKKSKNTKTSEPEERCRREERDTEQNHVLVIFLSFRKHQPAYWKGSLELKLRERAGGRRVRLLVTLHLQ